MKYLSYTLCFVFALAASSCVPHKQLVNFNEAQLNYQSPEAIINAMELRVQPDDLLRISVTSFDPQAAAPFNAGSQIPGNLLQQNQGAGTSGLELFTGYFVDPAGFIDFPVIGKIELGGLTLEGAKQKILGELETYLTDAVVNIRFLNFKVTMLGEVNSPGTLRLSNSRVTILEALGLAGDLTNYANRNEILVIREQNGERQFQRLDLQSAEIFSSPYFYLQQNDVVYVEPIQAKIATVADPAQRIISYTTAVLSITTLIIALTR